MKHKFTIKFLTYSMIGLSLTSLFGCQTVPTATSNPTATAMPALTTAHDLLSYSLLHRFDQSYDYQKTTKYQVSPLYHPDDIENNNHSAFLTFLTLMSGEHKVAKDREVSLAVANCEQNYTKQYLDWVNRQNALQPTVPVFTPLESHHADNIDNTAEPKLLDPTLASIQSEYETCLTNANDTASTESEELLITKSRASEFTTIGSIIASQAPDDSYPTTVKKMADYLNELADSHDLPKENSVKTEAEKINDIDNENAMGKPPKKITADSESQTTNSDETEYSEEEDMPTSRSGKLIETIKNFKVTPEQLQVVNDAMLAPKTLQYQGSFDKATGQLSSVLTESTDSPYQQSYKRVPMLIDFNEMSLTFEPDALLPMASLLSDKALPKDLAGKSVKFVLPDNLKQNIPLPLLKDSLITATAKAYSDLDSEKFTETLMDDYGKLLHASRVVKVNLTSQDMGFVIGRTLKYWSQSLHQLQQQHPEYIKNDSNFSATLELMAAVNRNYRAEDVAKLAQFIEAILPISYDSFNYYYFNSQNQMIGYRKVRNYRSSLLQATAKSVTTNQITYRSNTTNKPHLYYQPKVEDTIDGNALLQQLIGEKKLAAEAQDARFGYLEDVESSGSASVEPVEPTEITPMEVEADNDSDSSTIVPEKQKY